MKHRHLLAIIAAALCACGGSELVNLKPPALAAQIIVVLGDSQVAQVHRRLPQAIQIRVLDDKQKAIPNQPVSWRIVKGGGSVFAGFGVTNDSGVTQELWTLGDTAGVQILEARAVDSLGTPIVLGRAVAISTPGPLAFSGTSSHRVFAFLDSVTPLPFFFRDAYGNDLPARSIGVVGDSARFGGLNGTSWTPRDLGVMRFVYGIDTVTAFSIFGPSIKWSRVKGGSGTAAFVGVDSSGSAGFAPAWGAILNYNGIRRMIHTTDTLSIRNIEFQGSGLNLTQRTATTWRYAIGGGDTLVVARQ